MFLQKNALTIARIMSFPAVLLVIVNAYLALIASSFLPNEGKIVTINLLSLMGVALGSFLCPLFHKTQFKTQAPFIGFILSVVLPNVILRFMGVSLWIESQLAHCFIQIFTGMLYPVSIGLFLQTHILGQKSGENRTGKYCAFFFAVALALGMMFRRFFLSLLEGSGLNSDPLKAAAFTYNITPWIIASIGLFAVISTILLAKCDTRPQETAAPKKTNWSIILRLIGLSAVYNLLNSAIEKRLFQVFFYSAGEFDIYPFILGIALPILTLLAGRSINYFLKFFIPAVITLFILFPCMVFFENSLPFIRFMDILTGIFNHLIWVVFTIALIENYAGRYWFFALASAIYFTFGFSMLSSIVVQFIPEGTEFTVLICGIATVLFVFLALRIIFPKHQESSLVPAKLPQAALPRDIWTDKSPNANLVDILKQQKLSKREIEVANLMLREGLEAEEIGNRLFISLTTVKTHIASIYRKFDVSKRGEFMALFIRQLEKEELPAHTSFL